MVNEAALLAARAKRKSVEQQDLSEAIERVVAGLEKKAEFCKMMKKRLLLIMKLVMQLLVILCLVGQKLQRFHCT